MAGSTAVLTAARDTDPALLFQLLGYLIVFVCHHFCLLASALSQKALL